MRGINNLAVSLKREQEKTEKTEPFQGLNAEPAHAAGIASASGIVRPGEKSAYRVVKP